MLDVFSVRSENNKNIYLIKKMFVLEQPEVCSNTDSGLIDSVKGF